MPEAPAAAPAPAAPAPAAPAPAPAAPSTPGGMFDHLAIQEKAPPAKPAMDAPLVDPTLPQSSHHEVPKPGAPAEPAAEPTPKPDNPAEAVKPTWQSSIPETKHFKDPKDVEVAYRESSKEGRRLAGVVKESEAALAKSQQEVAALKMQIDLGFELKDLTDEQMANMTPQGIALHVAKQSEQKQNKLRLEERQKAQSAEAKKSEDDRVNLITSRAKAMERDTEHFPDFAECKPLMEDLLDYEPGLAGHANTPMILYLAAKGIRAAETEKASKAAAADAAAKAKAKAAADAAGAGGTGAAGSETRPAGTRTDLDPNSDAAHNVLLLRGNRPKPVFSL